MSELTAKICLFGASPGTGNQGVNALCWSALTGLTERTPGQIRVFQYGVSRNSNVVPGSEPQVQFRSESISVGKRIWRSDHMSRALYAARMNSRRNMIVNMVRRSDAVLDASGGDSFTDLYGAARFRSVIAPKRLALTLGRPLILLPQTYGPFESAREERLAGEVIGKAALAYARDRGSYEYLRRLLGGRFDPGRHRPGVDLAFGLRPSKPAELETDVQRILSDYPRRPLIAMNVSGLLANQAEMAKSRFKLTADYRALTSRIVCELLDKSDAQILLLSHVHAPRDHYESDLDACLALAGELPARYQAAAADRVTILKNQYDAAELKWIIGQADWVCGTRMHAAIAALSQCVPVCALAYSPKAGGVFEACGADEAVVDLRFEDLGSATEKVLWTWHNREILKTRMSLQLPDVLARNERQLDEITGYLRARKAA
jgi:polysaccharide pyruvyl transferase WcaK-like protein